MKKTSIQLAAVVIVLLFLSSCAPPGPTEEQYGFFYGILHGMIFIFVLIGKIFGADAGLIAMNNTGWPYYLGLLIGLMIVLGGGGYSSRRRG